MAPPFRAFPPIVQYRNCVKNVINETQYAGRDENDAPMYDGDVKLPILEFEGTVKLHGTNACVAYTKEHGVWAQSRRKVITAVCDNAGFASFVDSTQDVWPDFFTLIGKHYEINLSQNTVRIFGEWCGGNIQKGVALNGIEKMFVIFAIEVCRNIATVLDNKENMTEEKVNETALVQKEGDAYWLHEGFCDIALQSHERHIYNIHEFPKFNITIDFNDPKASTSALAAITHSVERMCPVGKFFGKDSTDHCTTGEGVVWRCTVVTDILKRMTLVAAFKVKGKLHAGTKCKTLAAVDVEKMRNIAEFVDLVVTEGRLNQGVETLFTSNGNVDPQMQDTPEFASWLVADVEKEESDTIRANGLRLKDVRRGVKHRASEWFRELVQLI
jgi:hypothetical protein